MTNGPAEENLKRPLGATILIVIGILWMSLTGLCTAGFIVVAAVQGGGGMDLGMLLQWAVLCLIVGVICALPGLVIWAIGRKWAWLKTRRR